MTDASSPPRIALLLLSGLLLASIFLTPAASAQAPGTAAELLEPENVRIEPNGQVIARLEAGTRVAVVERIDGWTRVRVRGSVWMESLITRDGGDFDLQVTAEDGENLRAEPSGAVLGRLEAGTLLSERGREPGWVHVERIAWIWSQSLGFADDTGDFPVPVRIEADPDPDPDPVSDPDVPPASGDTLAEDPPPAIDPTASLADTGAATSTGEPAEPLELRSGLLLPLSSGQVLLARPGADTLAILEAGTEAEVQNREGDWVQVRIEAWIPDPGRDPEAEDPLPPLVAGVTATDLATEPDRYRGARVELDLQFISLEVAEAIRADFVEGEPFLLTRSAGAGQRFVYIAIDPDRVEEFEGLAPLERIRVEGRVRTGAAVLTGHPVLDLLEWQRVRR